MGELERLGETEEWGRTLIWLLGQAGWTVTIRPAIGEGVLVIARRGACEIKHQGPTLADVAYPVFNAAMRTRRLELVR